MRVKCGFILPNPLNGSGHEGFVCEIREKIQEVTNSLEFSIKYTLPYLPYLVLLALWLFSRSFEI